MIRGRCKEALEGVTVVRMCKLLRSCDSRWGSVMIMLRIKRGRGGVAGNQRCDINKKGVKAIRKVSVDGEM